MKQDSWLETQELRAYRKVTEAAAAFDRPHSMDAVDKYLAAYFAWIPVRQLLIRQKLDKYQGVAGAASVWGRAPVAPAATSPTLTNID